MTYSGASGIEVPELLRFAVAVPHDMPVDLRNILFEGHEITSKVLFDDDIWDISGATSFRSSRSRNLRFDSFDDRYRPLAKLVAVSLSNPGEVSGLSGVDPAMLLAAVGRRSPSWSSVSSWVDRLRRALDVLLSVMEESGIDPLDVRREEWYSIPRLMADRRPKKGGPRSSLGLGTVHQYALMLRTASLVAEAFGAARPVFGTHPWAGENLARVVGLKVTNPRVRRNSTRPVAEAFAWLGADRLLIETTADDVIERVQFYATRQVREIAGANHCSSRDWNWALDRWVEAGFSTLPTTVLAGRSREPQVSVHVVQRFAGVVNPRPVQRATLEASLRRLESRGVRLELVPACDHVDPYVLVTGAAAPRWLGGNAHLLPTSTYDRAACLWDHSDALVWACKYGLNTSMALRDLEIGCLATDCMSGAQDENGESLKVVGVRAKNTELRSPPETHWFTTTANAEFISVVARLRRAKGLPDELHPQNGRRVLFTHSLLGPGPITSHRRQVVLDMGSSRVAPSAERPSGNSPKLDQVYDSLSSRGIGAAVTGLRRPSSRECRISALSAMVNMSDGVLAAVAHGKWSTAEVALGYIGHLPDIVTAHDPAEVEDERKRKGEVTNAIRSAVSQPGTLSGGGVAVLRSRAEAAGLGPNTIDGGRIARALRSGPLAVVVGVTSTCVQAEGGLCSGTAEARLHQCVLGCGNAVYTESQRAYLELTRQVTADLLGRNHRAALKIENHADVVGDLYGAERSRLVRIIAAGWDSEFVTMYEELVGLRD